MKKPLILATQNQGKVVELKQVLSEYFEVQPLPSAFNGSELPENGLTLEENALEKARFVHAKTGCAVLADDTGLEVEALEMRPGVFSARYGGPEKNAEQNMAKLISELNGKANRKAQFRTVLAFIDSHAEKCVEGTLHGVILRSKRGNGGFGYDPIFQPNGFQRSLAEFSKEEKNKISHRGRAIQEFLTYLIA